MSTTTVDTAAGAIETADLGVTLMHEHVFIMTTEIMENYPEAWGDGAAREADAIVVSEMKSADWYYKVWQSFAVLLPVKSVGVMGDERTYQDACAVRVVESQDGMTADWVRLPYDLLARISSRIVNEVKGINRCVLDITSKPPGTIEWE